MTTTLRADITAMKEIPMLDPAYIPTTFVLTDTLVEMNNRSGYNFLFNIEIANDPKGQPSLIFSPANLIIKDITKYNDPGAAKKVDALKVSLEIFNR